MSGRHHGLQPYVIYKLGGLTVTVSERVCDSCGRANLSLEYKSKRRSGGEVVICHLCMKDISADHAEYLNLRRKKPS